ncbi:hypothetical protein AMJ40_06675 [candidate division TA06 bacterium DG_26]|uniref:Uncharacterized protein n=1 Tax=candidate division TA06 bacterium DG_26 TaxID=1703771 RepID=A0A0S7WFF4_UNCT6|nr:MAG: hypothetical protein AMJ40_06675 [candidate division TA06 bacterium DG_26]
MRSVRKEELVTVCLAGGILLYAIVSLFSSFFHNPHEDPTVFHDDCPACRWEQQSQENPFDSTMSVHSLAAPGDSFAGLAVIEIRHIRSQGLFNTFAARSPPSDS